MSYSMYVPKANEGQPQYLLLHNFPQIFLQRMNDYGDRKKTHWKNHIGKKRTGKKRIR